ncbi:MAG: hypothetical protein FJZ01_08860 [Candidatus Sericytochromatia bacterium]|nr:hypothetical protein [Candidatus Tanganyikabacteria bacterium]
MKRRQAPERWRFALIPLAVLAIAACGRLWGTGTPSPEAAIPGPALAIRLAFSGRATQVVPDRYTRQDVAHVVLDLMEVSGGMLQPAIGAGGQPVSLDIPRRDFDSSIKLHNLRAGTTFRLQAFAYQAEGRAEQDLISVSFDESFTEFQVPGGSSLLPVQVRVKLKNRPFSGKATSPVLGILPGGLVAAGDAGIGKNRFDVSTVAGSEPGHVDGDPLSSRFFLPWAIAVGPQGDVFVADAGNAAIRRIAASGGVTTLAGGRAGFSDGTGYGAEFDWPMGISVGDDGSLFVADSGNHAIRRLTGSGSVTTIAGGSLGYEDGPAGSSKFDRPMAVLAVPGGDVLIADTGNHCIRRIGQSGLVETIAGMGLAPGFVDGVGSQARLASPLALAALSPTRIAIADTGNHAVRELDLTTLALRTLAGAATYGDGDGLAPGARFDGPAGLAPDGQGGLFIADSSNNTIRWLSRGGIVVTIAGIGYEGFQDGPGGAALLAGPAGLAAAAGGRVLVVDRATTASVRWKPWIGEVAR